MGTLAAPGARRSENKSSLHLYRHTGLLDRVCFFASVLQPLAFAAWAPAAATPDYVHLKAQQAKFLVLGQLCYAPASLRPAEGRTPAPERAPTKLLI